MHVTTNHQCHGHTGGETDNIRIPRDAYCTPHSKKFTSPQYIASFYTGFIRFNLHNLQSNFSTKHLSHDSKLKPSTMHSTYRVVQKSKPISFCHKFIEYFQNSYTDILSSKFAIKWSLKIPGHFKCVTTVPC